MSCYTGYTLVILYDQQTDFTESQNSIIQGLSTINRQIVSLRGLNQFAIFHLIRSKSQRWLVCPLFIKMLHTYTRRWGVVGVCIYRHISREHHSRTQSSKSNTNIHHSKNKCSSIASALRLVSFILSHFLSSLVLFCHPPSWRIIQSVRTIRHSHNSF